MTYENVDFRVSVLRNILAKYVRIFCTVVKCHKLFIWDSSLEFFSLLIFKKIYAFSRGIICRARVIIRVSEKSCALYPL